MIVFVIINQKLVMRTMYHISTHVYTDKIQQHVTEYNGKIYNTLYYDEDMLCTDDMDTGMYRSTIIAIPERKLLAFAPPKTLSMSKFKTLYPTLDNVVMHEYIDGRMLQLFYDSRIDSWRITPLMSKTDYIIPHIDEQAFIIACQGNIQNPLNQLAMLEFFPKNYCYTFVIRNQYTFHSSLFLLAVHQLQDSNLILPIPQCEYQTWSIFANITGIVCFPKQCVIGNSYEELIKDTFYNYTAEKWVLTNNQTGLQTTICTNEYNMMKRSAEINDLIKFQYLCLQRINKQTDYVKLYPSYKSNFYAMKQLYDWFIRTVHEMYIEYYINKAANNIPLKYKNDLANIHSQYYIKSLNRKKPMLITKHIIKKYFDKKDPHEIKAMINTYEFVNNE